MTPAALSMLVAASSAVTMYTAGPYPGAEVVLPKEPAARCAEWAKGRDASAARLCWRLIVRPAEWPTDRPITDRDLGAPSGFIDAAGLTEADFATFRKAATVSPFAIVPSKQYSDDWFRMTESCAEEPGALRTDGIWRWCKPDPDLPNPYRREKRVAARVGPIVASVVSVVGLVWLLVVGGRARRRRDHSV